MVFVVVVVVVPMVVVSPTLYKMQSREYAILEKNSHLYLCAQILVVNVLPLGKYWYTKDAF